MCVCESVCETKREREMERESMREILGTRMQALTCYGTCMEVRKPLGASEDLPLCLRQGLSCCACQTSWFRGFCQFCFSLSLSHLTTPYIYILHQINKTKPQTNMKLKLMLHIWIKCTVIWQSTSNCLDKTSEIQTEMN